MKFKVELTFVDGKGYLAYVPGLPGCVAQGNSLDEVTAGIRDAIELYLRALNDDPGARTPDTQIIEVAL
jgi:predicted RNase H-like HicB family nuclease